TTGNARVYRKQRVSVRLVEPPDKLLAPEPGPLGILFEDAWVLIVNKPAGTATQGALPSEESLLEAAKQDVKIRFRKPGAVYLGVVSRLDKPVSGAVVFARTSKAAKRLNEQFRARTVRKTYWAAVSGNVRPVEARLVHWLATCDDARRTRVVSADAPGAKEAALRYRLLQELEEGALLEIELETGRKHQIRAQLAHLGHPIFGDRKYGSRRPFPHGVALHARRLEFEHPTRKVPIQVEAPLPAAWNSLGLSQA
ncbi:MAG: RluA family pseudouridine synthase, partial [Planctomycetales bacterium]